MPRLLRQFWPRSQTHLVFARPLNQPIPPVPPPVALESIASTTDQRFHLLDTFATAGGFPNDWSADMLAEHARATLAILDDHQPIAMAWTTTHPFLVDEIGATFDPRGGVYLFGDFVSPHHRGKSLQRHLVNHRLTDAQRDGLPIAYTIIHPDNVPSVHSYQHEGFAEAARFTRYRWLKKNWCRCTLPSAPSGTQMPQFKFDSTSNTLVRV
jgi:ribosomal protein S18 acetylase RimI-like enzyme